jgi:hypothetical protein
MEVRRESAISADLYPKLPLGILKEAETGLLHMVVMTNSTAPQKYLVFLPQVCYDYFAAPSSVLT